MCFFLNSDIFSSNDQIKKNVFLWTYGEGGILILHAKDEKDRTYVIKALGGKVTLLNIFL